MITLSLVLLSAVACRGGEGDDTSLVDSATPGNADDADGDGIPASEDCDDTSATTYPGADELCDGVDNNCDGTVDEDAVDAIDVYDDADGDGFGESSSAQAGCEAGSGQAESGGDCDDSNDAVYPGAPEEDCSDPVDYNCDGQTGFADGDGDGFAACEECDDSDAAENPDAEELCDELDNDCDGETDEDGATDASTWYLDDDGDGFGDVDSSILACAAPEGYVGNDTDCDDTVDSINPDAAEACDLADNNCDGNIDEGLDATWYLDSDGDGFGSADSTAQGCEAPANHVSDATDCDDAAAEVNPSATEICNTIDDDCDGQADDDDDSVDLSEATTYYADSDGDGYGDGDAGTAACVQPSGTVTDGSDCADDAAEVNPGATEVCNTIDDDCDGQADDDDDSVDLSDATTYYVDSDGDGFGDASTGQATCAQPSGTVTDATDCADDAAGVNPDATEIWYDGVDQDCSGGSDFDQDGDGADSESETTNGTDLDDTDPTCSDDCFDGSGPDRAAPSCAGVTGDSGMYWVDADGDSGSAPPVEVYCETSVDGGGWLMVMWVGGDYHRDAGEVAVDALGDLTTHAKMSDEAIKTIALAGAGEVMIKHAERESTYVERYSKEEWAAFSVTGWRNVPYDAKGSDGVWRNNVCNGHTNNRGFSSWNDSPYAECPVVFAGEPYYMTSNHTQNYPGGVGNPFGVYIR